MREELQSDLENGGRIQDLLNNRRRLKVLEDGKGEVVVAGLEEFEANDPDQLLGMIDSANRYVQITII